MIIFKLAVELAKDAVCPDFAAQFKKQSTIDEKTAAWKADGWQTDPTACAVALIQFPDPENAAGVVGINPSDTALADLVDAICGGENVVTTGFTFQSTVLLNELVRRGLTKLSAKLYSFKLEYIKNNFVAPNIHSPIKVLKWDGMDVKLQARKAGCPDGATDLAVLAALAQQLGIK